MKVLNLIKKEHDIKAGKRCEFMKPTVTESCLLEYENEIIGFYLTELPAILKQYITIANKEFLKLSLSVSATESIASAFTSYS